MNDSLSYELFNTSFSLGVEVASKALIFIVVGCLLATALKGFK